jgi:hypothetical protein
LAQFQSFTPATLPAGFKLKTDKVGEEEIEYVKIDIGGTGASVPLTAANLSGSWLSQANRSLVINYTDATQTVIDNVVFKESGATVYTLTRTTGTTTETWTRS